MMPIDVKNKTGRIFRQVQKLMGNRFEISVVAEKESWAFEKIQAAFAEISRIETLLTTYNEHSQTNLVNRNAGIAPVRVDKEFIDLVLRAQKISVLTQGAFDLSYGSIDKSLWNFDQQMQQLPSPEVARKLVRLINYRNIITDTAQQTVFLKEKGMRIGFGGIGKGYAAEKAKALLQQQGVHSGIVNAAGDLVTWGHHPGGKPWTIGIASPDAIHEPFSFMNISDMAMATSGNYEKFAIIDGKKYAHTIDPKTGLPVQGIRSVTIISPNAEIADAMATPVMIMGIEVGLDMINQVKGLACLIIDDDNHIHTSKNIRLS